VIDPDLPEGEGHERVSTIRSNPLTRGLPVIGLTVASTFGEGTRPLATGISSPGFAFLRRGLAGAGVLIALLLAGIALAKL
jgi:hypothetical protein